MSWVWIPYFSFTGFVTLNKLPEFNSLTCIKEDDKLYLHHNIIRGKGLRLAAVGTQKNFSILIFCNLNIK